MTTAFTPGPWLAHQYLGEDDNWFVRGLNDARVCGQGSGRVSEANARLIAAAPELYEALTRINDTPGFALDIDWIRRISRGALAKANGEQIAT